jgi:hypothetical protein
MTTTSAAMPLRRRTPPRSHDGEAPPRPTARDLAGALRRHRREDLGAAIRMEPCDELGQLGGL